MPATEFIDLRKQRELDTPIVMTPADVIKLKAQQEIGAVMDKMVKREQFLKKNKTVIESSDSLLLYRLPLNDEQIANIYTALLDHSKKMQTV